MRSDQGQVGRKALEIGPGFKRASDPDRSMPPNVFQHPKNRNPPPHVRAALDHPLSLADAADDELAHSNAERLDKMDDLKALILLIDEAMSQS